MSDTTSRNIDMDSSGRHVLVRALLNYEIFTLRHKDNLFYKAVVAFDEQDTRTLLEEAAVCDKHLQLIDQARQTLFEITDIPVEDMLDSDLTEHRKSSKYRIDKLAR